MISKLKSRLSNNSGPNSLATTSSTPSTTSIESINENTSKNTSPKLTVSQSFESNLSLSSSTTSTPPSLVSSSILSSSLASTPSTPSFSLISKDDPFDPSETEQQTKNEKDVAPVTTTPTTNDNTQPQPQTQPPVQSETQTQTSTPTPTQTLKPQSSSEVIAPTLNNNESNNNNSSNNNNNNNNNETKKQNATVVSRRQTKVIKDAPLPKWVAEMEKEKEEGLLEKSQPTRLIEHFFIVGVSTSLEPLDNHYDYAIPPVENSLSGVIYKGQLLECYPPIKMGDDAVVPPHIWMFCFPKGAIMEKNLNAPSFFPYVLTALDGSRIYGSCLTFYEPVTNSMREEFKRRYKAEAPNIPIYTPKCLCILSRLPIFSIFRGWLNEFYYLSLNSSSTPLEQYIYNLVHEVPLPKAGGPPIQFSIGSLSLQTFLPSNPSLPVVDVPFRLLFSCLDISHIIIVFRCILLEEKVVFVSDNYTILTIATEVITSLMYPFVWPHVFVPILPELLLDFVYSPTPFVMGVTKSCLEPIRDELVDDIVIVDLDCNTVHVPQSRLDAIPLLPEKESSILINELHKVVNYEIQWADLPHYNIHGFPNRDNYNEYSPVSMFPKLIPPVGSEFDEFTRLLFLNFFASLFHNYREFLMYLRVLPKPIAMFNKVQFLGSKDPESREFLTKFMDTQAFAYFLEAHNFPLPNVFDLWINNKRFDLPVKYGDTLVKKPTSSIIIAPTPESINSSSNSWYNYNLSSSTSTLISSSEIITKINNNTSDSNITTGDKNSHTPTGDKNNTNNSNNNDNNNNNTQGDSADKNNNNNTKGDNNIATVDKSNTNTPTADKSNTNNDNNNNSNDNSNANTDNNNTATPNETNNNNNDNDNNNTKTGDSDTITVVNNNNSSSTNNNTNNNSSAIVTDVNTTTIHENTINDDTETVGLEINIPALSHTATPFPSQFKKIAKEITPIPKTTSSDLNQSQKVNSNSKFFPVLNFSHSPSKPRSAITIQYPDKLSSSNNNNNHNNFIALHFIVPIEHNEKYVTPGVVDQTQEEVSFRALLSRLFTTAFTTGLMEHSDVLQTVETLKFDFGRRVFADFLLTNPYIVGEPFGRLAPGPLLVLVDIFQAALREANANNDLNSPQKYMDAACLYHKISNGAQDYLYTRLKNQDMWQTQKFWEKYYYDKVEVELRKLYKNDILGQMNAWLAMPLELKLQTVAKEEQAVFNLVFTMAFNMVNLALPPETIRKFASKMSLSVSLDDEHTTIIMKLVGTMATGHQIAEELSQDQLVQQDKDARLKLVFGNSESYLPIGLTSNLEGEGKEMFRSLVNERSAISNQNENSTSMSSGGIKVFSRRMNLKTKWTERMKQGQINDSKGDRGEYVIKTFTGHEEGVLCLAYCPPTMGREYARLLTGSCDATVKVWDTLNTQCVGTLTGHVGWVTVCEVEASDTSKAITGSYDHSLKVWDLVKCQKIRSLRGHKGSISALMVANSGGKLISGSYDNTSLVWDCRHAKPSMTLSGHTAPVMCLYWDVSPNPTYPHMVISGSRDTTIKIWDLRTGKVLHTLSGHGDWVKSISYSSLGRGTLLSGGCDGITKVWDVNDGKCLRTLQGHTGTINGVSVIENGESKFITCSADCLVKVWSALNPLNETAQTLSGHVDEVVSCTPFLSSTLATASYDGTVKIWSPSHSHELRSVNLHNGNRISCMRSFENSLLTAAWDKTAKICEFSLDFRPN